MSLTGVAGAAGAAWTATGWGAAGCVIVGGVPSARAQTEHASRTAAVVTGRRMSSLLRRASAAPASVSGAAGRNSMPAGGLVVAVLEGGNAALLRLPDLVPFGLRVADVGFHQHAFMGHRLADRLLGSGGR